MLLLGCEVEIFSSECYGVSCEGVVVNEHSVVG